MFRYKNRETKNNEIQNIAITVELGEEFKNNSWKLNELHAKRQLTESRIKTSLSIECPIDDLVYLQPKYEGETDEGYYIKTEKDYELLKSLIFEIKKCFKDKVVEVSVHSDNLCDEGNEFSMSIEEFLTVYDLD